MKQILFVILLLMVSSCGQSEVERLREQVAVLEEENSELRSRIEELEGQNSDYESQIIDLEDDNFALESDLEDSKNTIEDARNAVDNLRMQRIIDGDAYTSHGMMQDMDIDDIENSLDY